MGYELDLTKASWLNKPAEYSLDTDKLSFKTEPGTDFWQRSYYGFRNDNAPALLFNSSINFTLTARVEFDYNGRFDQAGIIIYLDSDNWFKASIEYENSSLCRLGSVVTNLGYSDWATTDIGSIASIWYRLSRRAADFMIEVSFDGVAFEQIRIFHLHLLGDTDPDIAKMQSLAGRTEAPVNAGFYACSPLASSFIASFSNISYEDSIWQAHS